MSQRARTLAIDIGGTGLKALVLDHAGAPLTDRAREETPKPSTPTAVLEVLDRVVAPLGAFDRVSVGFPGVVVDGVTHSAPNLGAEWKGFPLVDTLKRRFAKPVRALNDAGVQGFGIVRGKGTELVLTLGTGMGFALFVDGRYVPNLELAHHPFRKGKTYEEYIGAKALEEVGKKAWNRRVERVIAQIQPVFNPTTVYLGGGNAKKLKIDLPANVKIADNVAGLLGGIALWRDP
ncbi:MAG: ROK family protein [Polyangiaceae bacterium]|nr:ROK family protein [Polyangiaceae bacterium]